MIQSPKKTRADSSDVVHRSWAVKGPVGCPSCPIASEIITPMLGEVWNVLSDFTVIPLTCSGCQAYRRSRKRTIHDNITVLIQLAFTSHVSDEPITHCVGVVRSLLTSPEGVLQPRKDSTINRYLLIIHVWPWHPSRDHIIHPWRKVWGSVWPGRVSSPLRAHTFP